MSATLSRYYNSIKQNFFGFFVDSDEERYYERQKLFFLTLAFFCVIGAYTIAKELKNSVFAFTVGESYINWARPGALFVMFPAIFLYSKLVDKLRRYQLLCVYSGIYALLGLFFTYLLGHPTIGISNPEESPYRLFGWIFYFFVEGYSPFVVSVFWSFANSVSSPEGAKRGYGLMVSGSKIGGILVSCAALVLLGVKTEAGCSYFSDVASHQILLAGSSLLLLLVPVIIFAMTRTIPASYLHGYEAVYQLEKERQRHGESQTGIFAGLYMFFKYPYVLGIFGMSFFYEVVSTIMSFLAVTMAKKASNHSASETLTTLLWIILLQHLIGFLISFFGTTVLFNKLGTKRCLLFIPFTAGIVLLYYLFDIENPKALIISFVALRSINYAFSFPLRESLYIPTIRDIKFKSKSWIDAFGTKSAKTAGSGFNLVADWIGSAYYFATYSGFFAGIVALWAFTAWILGKRFEHAVKNSEIIGTE